MRASNGSASLEQSNITVDHDLVAELLHQLGARGYTPSSGGIVGRNEYLRLMDEGAFRVGPFPERYKVPGNPEGECPFGPTTMTLSLGTVFVAPKPGIIVDLMERTMQGYLGNSRYSYHVNLQQGDKVAIMPKGLSKNEYSRLESKLRKKYGERLKLVVVGFVNGQTLQTIEFFLPVNGEVTYAGFVTSLTRTARFGVDVEKAPRVHAPNKHPITLEFDNNGPTIFVLTVGEQPVANLTIVPVIGAPATAVSTVLGQVDPSGRTSRRRTKVIIQGTGNGVLILPVRIE